LLVEFFFCDIWVAFDEHAHTGELLECRHEVELNVQNCIGEWCGGVPRTPSTIKENGVL
jgi:hypothetical protein